MQFKLNTKKVPSKTRLLKRISRKLLFKLTQTKPVVGFHHLRFFTEFIQQSFLNLFRFHGFSASLTFALLLSWNQTKAQELTYQNKTISEYQSSRPGYFVEPVTVDFLEQKIPFAIGNVDGDSNLDIYVLDGANDKMLAFEIVENEAIENTGSDNRLDSVLPINGYRNIGFADLDGDGDSDLLYHEFYAAPQIPSFVYYENTNDTFIETPNSIDAFPTYSERNFTFCDLDSDQDLDLIYTGYNDNTDSIQRLHIHENIDGNIQNVTSDTAAFGLSELKTFVDTNNSYRTIPRCVDFDDDNDQDLFVFSEAGGSPKFYYLENSNDIFQSPQDVTDSIFSQLSLNDISNVTQFDFYDFDGDGDYDLIKTNSNQKIAFKIYENINGEFYNPAIKNAINTTTTPIISLVDFDDDSDHDIIISYNQYDTQIKNYYFENANGEFQPNEKFTDSLKNVFTDQISSFSMADIDQDGELDLYLLENDGTFKVFSFNSTTKVFADISYNYCCGPSSVASTFQNTDNNGRMISLDIDNDGDSDLIGTDDTAESNTASYLTYFENETGTPFSSAKTPSDPGYIFSAPATGDFFEGRLSKFDFDLDGDMDVMTISATSEGGNLDQINIFLNESGDFNAVDLTSQAFGEIASFDALNLSHFELTDINQDGLADIIYTKINDNEVYIYESNYSGNYKEENSKLKSSVSFESDEVLSGEVTLSWQDDSILNNPTYTIEVATSQTFDGVVYSVTTDQSSITVNPSIVLSSDFARVALNNLHLKKRPDILSFTPNTLFAGEEGIHSNKQWLNYSLYYLSLLVILILLTSPINKRTRKYWLTFLASLLLLIAACSTEDDSSDDSASSSSNSSSGDSDSEESGNSVYWKITAEDANNNNRLISGTFSFQYMDDSE